MSQLIRSTHALLGATVSFNLRQFDTTNENIICSYANHRDDVIASIDGTGSLTSFALYEAYGTRPYEWGYEAS